MPIITDQQEKLDYGSFRIPEFQEIDATAEKEATAALEQALASSAEEQRFNLEDDDVLDTNPAILQATQALGDAQKAAQNVYTERKKNVESPIQICEFVSKAGPAINQMRRNALLIQDPETIAALRMRSKS